MQRFFLWNLHLKKMYDCFSNNWAIFCFPQRYPTGIGVFICNILFLNKVFVHVKINCYFLWDSGILNAFVWYIWLVPPITNWLCHFYILTKCLPFYLISGSTVWALLFKKKKNTMFIHIFEFKIFCLFFSF